MNQFQNPMKPFPGLENFARTVQLSKSQCAVHMYKAGEKSKPPMMLVHGLGDDADTWAHLIPTLSQTHHIIALDLPGFGRSERPNRAYTLAFFENVVLELMDTQQIPQAILVGHSLGAMICHTIALNHPERVTRLILLDGSLVARAQKLNRTTLMFLIPGLGEWMYNSMRRDPQAAYASLAPYYADMQHLAETDRQFLFQRVNERVWSDGQRRAFLSTFRNLASTLTQQKDLPTRLAQMKIPTLAIWGEQDAINLVDNGRALAEQQPNTRLVIVPNAGHNVQQENPQAVIKAINQFE
jgi:pimeloyl-ACP methyl ester carboxylesterase